MLTSSRSQWVAAAGLVLVPVVLMEAFCQSRPEARSIAAPLATTTGTLGFATGDYYVHGNAGTLRLQCPTGGGGAGSVRRRWCFNDGAWLLKGKLVTVRHERPMRQITISVAVVHEVRTATESLLHDVQ